MVARDDSRPSDVQELLREVKIDRPSEPPALAEPWPRDGRSSQPPSPWDSVVFENVG
jgi:hypothetical protein